MAISSPSSSRVSISDGGIADGMPDSVLESDFTAGGEPPTSDLTEKSSEKPPYAKDLETGISLSPKSSDKKGNGSVHSISRSKDPSTPLDDLERVAFEDDLWASYYDNPHNWSFWKKWRMAGIVSAYTFTS
jgi:hypothetical protein